MKCSALLLALVCAFVLPTAANATVHSGSVTLEEPAAEGTLGPTPPPLVETGIYLHSVGASYDDQAGSFTITVEVFDPAHWGPQFGTLFFTATGDCSEDAGVAGRLGSGTEGSTGEVSLSGLNGELTSFGIFNGLSTTFTFQSQYFKGQEWHCVTFSPNGVYGSANPLARSFSLGDYPPPQPPDAPLPQLVCYTPRGYYVGYVRPRECRVQAPRTPGAYSLTLTHLRWSSWSATHAVGVGYEIGNHPRQPGSRPYPVRLVAFGPARNPTTGAQVFTHLTQYSRYQPHGYTVRPY
jgi:hypothetical protein